MSAGVYSITCATTGERYIGGTKDLSERWRSHLCNLRHGRHYSRRLQDAWNKYGEAAFQFRVLLYCDPWNCILFEQRAVDMLKPEYNITSAGGKGNKNHLGHHHSAATRAHMSATRKGRNLTAGTRAKMSVARKKYFCSPKARAKASAAQKAYWAKRRAEVTP